MEYEVTLVASVKLPDEVDISSVAVNFDSLGRLVFTMGGKTIAGPEAVSYIFLEDTLKPEEEWFEEGFSDHTWS
jgi:hypothetical protein